MEFKSLESVTDRSGYNVILYGESGFGKTYSISTLPDFSRAVIIAAEPGLKTLRDNDMPEGISQIRTLVATTYDEFDLAARLIRDNISTIDTVVIDSLSKVSERILTTERERTTDARHLYPEMEGQVMRLLNRMLDLECNLICICKQGMANVAGFDKNAASFPGRQLPKNLPYEFDYVFALRQREEPDGTLTRCFQTQPCPVYHAKTRGNKLDQYETPNWKNIFNKLNN